MRPTGTERPTRNERLARLFLWLVPAMWASNHIIARVAPDLAAPHAMAFGRWLIAFALLLPFVWHKLPRDGAVWRREWKHLLVLGALGMWICGAWVYLGGQSTTATNIALIYSVTPVSIVVLSAWLLRETLGTAQKLGVALAFAGVLFVIAKGDWRELQAVRLTVGDAWIVGAAISWTAYSVLLKHWPSSLGALERLVAIIAGGLVVMLPFTLAEAWWAPGPPLGAAALGLMALAAVLPGVLSYGAYSFLMRELGASRTALMLYLAPVYGALLAWALLGERPGWYHAVGAALILPSIWLATRR